MEEFSIISGFRTHPAALGEKRKTVNLSVNLCGRTGSTHECESAETCCGLIRSPPCETGRII